MSTLKPNIDSSHVTFLEKYGLYERKYEELYEKERKLLSIAPKAQKIFDFSLDRHAFLRVFDL